MIKLYVCSDESGSLHIRETKGGPLEQSDLDSNDAFIVDNGKIGIWVWIGKKATRQERAEAMRNAQGFIKKKGWSNICIYIYIYIYYIYSADFLCCY